MAAPKWQKKLTKTQIKHINETSAGTLRSLKINLKSQALLRHSMPKDGFDPCPICREIAERLGYPVIIKDKAEFKATK
jgi:hypothetical protein